MTATRRVVAVTACLAGLGACDQSGVRNLSDASVVTAYLVHCDSVVELGHCYGPTHRGGTIDYTVIISQQQVLQANVHPFGQCLVLEPRHWYCFDEDRKPVYMGDFEMHWAELDSAKEAAVSKMDYCASPDTARGKPPSFSTRLKCSL